MTKGGESDMSIPSDPANILTESGGFRRDLRTSPARYASQQQTHLFEAEGHGEHTDSNDAVHHVHNEARVGRRHL